MNKEKITPVIFILNNPDEYLLAWRQPDNSLSLYPKEGRGNKIQTGNYASARVLQGEVELILKLYPETYALPLDVAILIERLVKEEESR